MLGGYIPPHTPPVAAPLRAVGLQGGCADHSYAGIDLTSSLDGPHQACVPRTKPNTPGGLRIHVDKAAPPTSNLLQKELEDTKNVLSEPTVLGMLAVIGVLVFIMMTLIVVTVFLCLRLPGGSLGNAPHYHPAPDYKA